MIVKSCKGEINDFISFRFIIGGYLDLKIPRFSLCYPIVRISFVTVYTGRGRKHAQAGSVVIPDGKTRRKYRVQFFSYDVSFLFFEKSSLSIDRVCLNVANSGVPDWARLNNRQDVVPRVKISEECGIKFCRKTLCLRGEHV